MTQKVEIGTTETKCARVVHYRAIVQVQNVAIAQVNIDSAGVAHRQRIEGLVVAGDVQRRTGIDFKYSGTRAVDRPRCTAPVECIIDREDSWQRQPATGIIDRAIDNRIPINC